MRSWYVRDEMKMKMLLRGPCNYIVIYFEKIIIYLKVLSIARLKNAKIIFFY